MTGSYLFHEHRIGHCPGCYEKGGHYTKVAGVIFGENVLVGVLSHALEPIYSGGLIKDSFCASEMEIREGKKSLQNDLVTGTFVGLIDFKRHEQRLKRQMREDLAMKLIGKLRYRTDGRYYGFCVLRRRFDWRSLSPEMAWET
jgi:hypothetical protein